MRRRESEEEGRQRKGALFQALKFQYQVPGVTVWLSQFT